MNESRERLVAALAVQMRTPLSRIELAASELARAAGTPREQTLAGRVSRAVCQLDRLVARSLELLRPAAPRTRTEDLWPELEALYERFSPVITARGVHWNRTGSPPGVISGDPLRLRQAGLRLLRAPRAPSARAISLELVGDAERYGLALELEAAPHAAPPELPAAVREDIRAFALGNDGQLEESRGERTRLLTLWLPRAEVSCRAS